MDRVALLRWGYGAFGLSLAAFALSTYQGGAVFVGILLAFVGALLLAFSGDDLPRWSGVAMLLYFVVTLLVFLAATPVTIRLDFFKGFVNDDPPAVLGVVFDYLVLAMPIMVVGTAIAAAWEREWPPRVLLAGSIVGFILVQLLHFVLVPPGSGADAASTAEAVSAAEQQGDILAILFGVSAAVGALGALWAASRPDEYA